MKKFRNLALVLGLILAFCLGCGNARQQEAAAPQQHQKQELTVKMLDIGQGDAILIRTKEQVILMDTGDVDTRDQIVKILKNEKVEKIDKLIISHPHADHLGGAYAVLNNFKVGGVYDNGQPTTTATYRTYMKLIEKKKIPYQRLNADMTLDFGNQAVFKVFSPTVQEIKSEADLNSNSIVGKLSYGNFSMLFTGDCEADREKLLLKKYGQELKSDILKSPHHGSKTSSNRNFLKMVAPEAALISVGAGNDYKHPHKVTLNKYKDLNLKVYRTDQDGMVTVHTDGETYQITKEK